MEDTLKKLFIFSFIMFSLITNTYGDDKVKSMQLNIDSLSDKLNTGTASQQDIKQLIDYQIVIKDLKKEKEATEKFIGLNWGVGLAYTYIQGKASIDEAEVIDGVIRIKREHKRSAALMLESHYFLEKDIKKYNTTMGIGPFAAVNVIDTEGKAPRAYGLGLMAGFKRQPDLKDSWNIGVGYFVDTRVKRLGSGLSEGQALPGTETEIRYKETDSGGFMFMLSATFM